MIIEIDGNTFKFPKATKKFELEVKGDTPAKKNSKRIVFNRNTHKPFIISSERHNKWLDEGDFNPFFGYRREFPLEEVQSIICVFTRSSKRKYDIDNCLATIGDFLKEKGYIVDDNNKVCPIILGVDGGIDKVNPCAKVYILY